MLRSLQVLLVLCSLCFSSCGVYSFTGGSTGNAQTISIQYFPNKAALVNPNLSQFFTERMKDKFTGNTQLTLVDAEGDLNFEGYIADYVIGPAAVQGNNQAALNRLTITVNVKYTNKLEPEQNFERNFSQFADYESTKNITQVESDLVSDITDRITQEIFNASVANW